jgi:hypothetical protein
MDVFDVGECRSSAASLDRRTLLRLAVLSIIAASGLSRPGAASVVTSPIEQFYAALLQVMRAGKMAPFRQRYDVLAPVIDQTFDLEGILKSSVGLRWGALSSEEQLALAAISWAAPGPRLATLSHGFSALFYVPAALLGTWCGLGWYSLLSDAQFRTIVNLLLIASGMALAL